MVSADAIKLKSLKEPTEQSDGLRILIANIDHDICVRKTRIGMYGGRS